MFENRLREWFATSVPAGVSGSAEAYVPCSCSGMMGFGPAQIAFVAEVYRMARELTETQFRKPAGNRQPVFSIN